MPLPGIMHGFANGVLVLYKHGLVNGGRRKRGPYSYDVRAVRIHSPVCLRLLLSTK